VFNEGERVEGYTDFLWTVAIAPAYWLGVDPERWSHLLGGVAYVATVLVLGAFHVRLARRLGTAPLLLPFAAAAAAVHEDWAAFAVSGLETGAFTFFLVAGLVLAAEARTGRGAAAAGAAFALAALTRPEGVLYGALAGALLAVAARGAPGGGRRLFAFAACFGAPVLAHLAFRLGYYGAPFPNTYYAKSGGLAWWSQGILYLWLYVLRYPAFAIAPIVGAWATVEAVRRRSPLAAPAVLALVLGAAGAVAVVRVGGDFMFARFLIAPTALLFVALDIGLLWIAAKRSRPVAVAAAVVLIALSAVVPSPLPERERVEGIANEREVYSPERIADTDDRARRVRAVLDGLDARVAFYGGEARFVYYARIPTAIEGHAGLTDAFIARQPLLERGRVGHEKHAPPEYLVAERRVHLTFARSARRLSQIPGYVPDVPVDLGGVPAQLVHWDPVFVEALRTRGVDVPDYPAMIDEIARDLPSMTDARAVEEYRLARRFYFDFVVDPEREAPFRARTEGAPP
jgi:hypothetical protein